VHLEPDPKLEQSQRTFYALTNTFCQVSGGEPMSLDTEFWDPSKSLPYGLRNAAELFKRELAQHACPR
jgi:hypothetical protein